MPEYLNIQLLMDCKSRVKCQAKRQKLKPIKIESHQDLCLDLRLAVIRLGLVVSHGRRMDLRGCLKSSLVILIEVKDPVAPARGV
jgi:hypothetical protein